MSQQSDTELDSDKQLREILTSYFQYQPGADKKAWGAMEKQLLAWRDKYERGAFGAGYSIGHDTVRGYQPEEEYKKFKELKEVQMSSQEILTKAIEKAIAGGWNYDGRIGKYTKWRVAIVEDFTHDERPMFQIYDDSGYTETTWNFPQFSLIFNHDFAKALWGEDTNRLWKCPACGYSFEYYKHNETQEYCPNDGHKAKDVTEPKPVWEQKWADRLQEMVIADDPIKYLGENI